jgi:peptide/nickel transport system permease protein
VTDTVPIYDPTKGTATPSPAALEPEETSGPTAPAVSAPGPLSPFPAPGETPPSGGGGPGGEFLLTTDAEERVAVATQAQLMWRRFRKHRLAMLGAAAVIVFYLMVVLADFLAYADPEASDAQRGLIAPQQVRLFLGGQFRPHVYAMVGERDPTTFKRVYTEDPTQIIPLTFFSPGFDYKLFGFIPTNRHLIGVEGVNPEETLFLLGTDLEGRDMWSRVMYATRTSLTIGLIAVVVSLVLGVILGGISGFYGGMADTAIQRIIEILRSIPTIPLWMGLAAAMPKTWSITQVYFTITIIISLIGWTELARVVRGRFLSLREEDFVTAADLVGASQSRIIFVHMVPLFLSHIIAATTLALPAMIISETALSFLGLGLRPPAISWGVLLQQAQNVQTVALSPWLLLPALPVILVILAFNFLGDGLRDAADPYS